MAITIREHQAHMFSMKQTLPWAISGICLAALIASVAYSRFMTAQHQPEDVRSEAEASATVQTKGQPTLESVTLSPAKYERAKIATEPSKQESLPMEVSVVGRIELNSDQRVEIRARAAGIVREVHVVLGQAVKKGTPLVTLDSPDIGTARLNLRDKQRALATARFEQDWRSQIAATVAQLIPEMRKGVDPGVLERQFADRSLGNFRGALLGVYSDYDIAAHEESKTKTLREERLLGEHPSVLARHKREGAQARLEATIEQVRFDAAQEKRVADQKVNRAEADVIDAAQRLRILGVPEDIQSLLTKSDVANEDLIHDDVTRYQIDAPFDGTITAKSAVLSQKIEANDPLFTLADLGTVWVTANVPESEVAKLAQIKQGTVRVSATAYPGKIFSAEILSAGAIVDPQSRTLPLLARADNRDGLLKAGMFVRVILDGPPTEPSVTIPSSAVVEIEGKKCVFLPAPGSSDEKKFLVRKVDLGREADQRVVVQTGLRPGDMVVSQGAFVLKSELILQNEEDEE